jgi:RHS repeat-associated protein
MDARYEAPTLSRFLSQDPALITPASGQTLDNLLQDPQKLNFYSYVEDNPLKYTDPSGKQEAQAAIIATFADPVTALLAAGVLTIAEVGAIEEANGQPPFDPGSLKAETLAEPRRGFTPTPIFNPEEPPNGGGWWKGVIYAAGGVASLVDIINQNVGGAKDFIDDWKKKVENIFAPSQNNGMNNSSSGSYIRTQTPYSSASQLPTNIFSSNIQTR